MEGRGQILEVLSLEFEETEGLELALAVIEEGNMRFRHVTLGFGGGWWRSLVVLLETLSMSSW